LTRIFTGLASFAILMLLVTLLLGLYVGDLHQPHSQSTSDLAMVHRLFGIATALVVVLVNSIVMTYFIGTSRWCREVVETYRLEPALVARSAVLKRRAFPWASAAMLVVIGISALGAAADPATQRAGTEHWVVPHLVAALAGLLFIAWAFFQQGQRIAEHHGVITEILAHVARIRQERGLAEC
jgi:fucose permease